MKWELIWTNPNDPFENRQIMQAYPLYNNFAPNKVYDAFMIEVSPFPFTVRHVITKMMPLVKTLPQQFLFFSEWYPRQTSTTFAYRTFQYSDDKLICQVAYSAGNDFKFAEADLYMIPYKVYGAKIF